ncbi:MAG: prepilin-type N-terminal cleavage/methylation domain-containing protein [Deltaproteobacteria bacterium]|nr:prepilin-type N-terminal cleavage/methylation domain-containing protein [Deltaproteobacteria bacterium]
MTLKQTLRHPRLSNQGVTLIELMIAMTIFLLVLGAIYSTFQSQHKSYLMQEEVAAMQQNMRANGDSISFTEDIRGDADGSDPDGATNDPNESIAYALSDNNLVRNSGGGNQVGAENIDALDFVYLDADGNTTATLTDIGSVEITIVARTGRALRVTKDNNLYYNQQGTQILGAQNDNFSRKSMTTFIKCRNLGI